MVMRFPAKENAGCQKSTARFPAKKDDILHPASGCFGALHTLPQSLYGRSTYADVRTKISRIDRLPDLFTMVLRELR